MRAPRRDAVGLPIALVAPLLVTLALVPVRDEVANATSVLLLVLVIVAVAAFFSRSAGIVCALSSAFWFDLLLTEPYQRLSIDDQDDIEAAVLLLAVGVVVTELAVRGRRAALRAERDAAYLDGIQLAASAVSAGRSGGDLVEDVRRQLVDLLHLEDCRFEYGVAGLGRPARLRDDGVVEWHGTELDVGHDGLPADTEVELLAENGGRLQGRYLLSAGPRSRPSRSELLVAVTLAAQVAAALR